MPTIYYKTFPSRNPIQAPRAESLIRSLFQGQGKRCGASAAASGIANLSAGLPACTARSYSKAAKKKSTSKPESSQRRHTEPISSTRAFPALMRRGPNRTPPEGSQTRNVEKKKSVHAWATLIKRRAACSASGYGTHGSACRRPWYIRPGKHSSQLPLAANPRLRGAGRTPSG